MRFISLLRQIRAGYAKRPEAFPQTVNYARQCGADEAHLIVFDRRAGVPWDERIWQRPVSEQGWALGVWGA